MRADPLKAGGAEIPEITASDLQARLEARETLVLLDVREAFEREIADLPDHGQKHIPVAEVGERLDELDPAQLMVVYCRSGARSGAVLRFLQAKGFSRVLNLRGGILGWRDEVDPSIRKY